MLKWFICIHMCVYTYICSLYTYIHLIIYMCNEMSKDIQPVHLKGDQFWIFTGRTDAETETPILWPPVVKNWLIGKDPDAGKDWRQEEKGTTEDEMVGWHHLLNGLGFGQVPGTGDGLENLVWCNPWVAKRWTQLSDWTKLNWEIRSDKVINSLHVERNI